MAYEKIVFDGEALFSDAPRKELEALGAACVVGAAQKGALFVSARPEAVNAAFDAGLDCALALWRGVPARHARATYYLREPYDLAALLTRREKPYDGLEWMQTAVEMQFIAQAGLAYSKDPYDLERFARLREMAAHGVYAYGAVCVRFHGAFGIAPVVDEAVIRQAVEHGLHRGGHVTPRRERTPQLPPRARAQVQTV